MEATALILLAAGVGMNYGWQPMPDGNSRYEYIVQVEPELLATLGEEGSIPIVSEVPDDIGPIGRIRIVVGRGELPRERLDKRLKPTGDAAGASDDGAIELTQYNEYGAPAQRYGQPQAVASPDASSWNGGEAQSAAPASPGSSWNGAPISVAERTDDQGPMGRVGDRIDGATAPLRQGLEKVDDGVRRAVGNLGDRTQNLVDELGRPFQPLTNPAVNRAPAGANPNMPAAPTWNGGDAAAAPGGAAEAAPPRFTGQPNSWNESDAPALPEAPAYVGTGRGAAAAPQAGQAGAGGADWNSPTGGASSQRLDQPIDPRDVGRWENAAPAASPGGVAPGQAGRGAPAVDPFDYRRQADARGGADAGADRPSAGAERNPIGFPADPVTNGSRLPAIDNTAAAAAGGSPRIDSRMLQQPASRPLEGTDSAQAAASVTGPAFPAVQGPAFPATQQQSSVNSPQARDPRTTPASGQGWDRGGANPQGAQSANNGSGRQAAAALFAWVLLTSSAAGNLYLFWSYQDVRHKYRALVRKTARAVGSRLSAA